MNTRNTTGSAYHYTSAPLPLPDPPLDYVVLAFPRGGPPVEIGREPQQWMAQAVAFEERRRGTLVEIEERPRRAA